MSAGEKSSCQEDFIFESLLPSFTLQPGYYVIEIFSEGQLGHTLNVKAITSHNFCSCLCGCFFFFFVFCGCDSEMDLQRLESLCRETEKKVQSLLERFGWTSEDLRAERSPTTKNPSEKADEPSLSEGHQFAYSSAPNVVSFVATRSSPTKTVATIKPERLVIRVELQR
jgi:hypothetical protein